jgi:protein RecA
MVKKKESTNQETVGNYFIKPKDKEFISSGCAVLDCVLGGGYALGRVSNIVGDKSTGKTLLAIEACANFANTYPDGKIHYIEAESAFDFGYAEQLGMPMDSISFREDIDTIEDFFRYADKDVLTDDNTPKLLILDSLDALSDLAEQEEEIGAKTYSMGKQKASSKLFRTRIRTFGRNNVHLMFISQVRYNIGVTFGEKYTMAGGKALDMYASQRLWLAEREKIKRTVRGIERPIGIWIKALCKKNKIGLPYRSCDIPILFSYGIDDAWANLDFLKEAKSLTEFGIEATDKAVKAYAEDLLEKNDADTRKRIAKYTTEVWAETEKGFLPAFKKY